MTPVDPGDLAEGSRIRHRKRGTTYTVIGFGRFQGDCSFDGETVVMYAPGLSPDRPWVRPLSEVCDGRFELVTS